MNLYFALRLSRENYPYTISLAEGVAVAFIYDDFIDKAEFIAFLLEEAARRKISVIWVDLEGKFLPLLIQIKEKYGIEYGLFDTLGVLGAPVSLCSSYFFPPSLALMLNLDDRCFRKILRDVKYRNFNSVIKAVKKAKCRYENYDILTKILQFRDLADIERETKRGMFMLPYFDDKSLRFAYALALYLVQYLAGTPLLFLMEEPYLLLNKRYVWDLLTSPPSNSLYLHLIPVEWCNKLKLDKYMYLISPPRTSPQIGKLLGYTEVRGAISFKKRGGKWRMKKIEWRTNLNIRISEIEEVRKLAKALTREFYEKPPEDIPLVDTSVLDLSMKTILFKAILNLMGAYLFQYINLKTGFLADRLIIAFKIFEWAKRKIESNEKE